MMKTFIFDAVTGKRLPFGANHTRGVGEKNIVQGFLFNNPSYTRELIAVVTQETMPQLPLICDVDDTDPNAPVATNVRNDSSVDTTKLSRNISRKELTYLLTQDERIDIAIYLEEFPSTGTRADKKKWAKAKDAWQLFLNGDPIERDLIVTEIHPTVPVFRLLLGFFETEGLLGAGRAQELFDK